MKQPIIIIGAGLAGYSLAKELRKLGTDQAIVVITACQGRFYSKPLLSNALSQQKDRDSLTMASAEEMGAQLNAEVMTETEVIAIHPETHEIQLANRKINYDKLVLALGADLISPQLEGDACNEVMAVNHIEHYHHFRSKLANKKKVAILGAGLVGCEFANDLINTGFEVEMIAPCEHPLPGLLPKPLAETFQTDFANAGVRWRLNDTVKTMVHFRDGYQLQLASGEAVNADIVLSAIGLRPRVQLAKEAGLAVNRGIVVDDYCQTSMQDIYALGDCAEMGGQVRLFVAPLLHSARNLAKTLIGEPSQVIFPAMPIVIKTPTCKAVVTLPSNQEPMNWEATSLRAECRDQANLLRGFALVSTAVAERNALLKECLA